MRHLTMIVGASLLVFTGAEIGAASTAFAAPAYEIAVVPAPVAGSSPVFFRINVASGQVVWQSGSQYVLIVDSKPPPAGNYHLYRTESLDKKGSWNVDRVDSESGRTWSLSGGGATPFGWQEIAEPK